MAGAAPSGSGCWGSWCFWEWGPGASGATGRRPRRPSLRPRPSPRGWRASPSPRFMKAIKRGSWRPRRRIFTRTRMTISISGVRVEFFGPGEDIRVKADAGLFNTKTRVLTLTGQVEMRRGDLLVTNQRGHLFAGRAGLARPRACGDHGTGPQGGGQGAAGGTGRQEAGYGPTPSHRIAG